MVKKTDFNSMITEVEGKIPSISGLATSSALTAVENKIPDVSSLITKTDFDSKLKAISDRATKNKSKHLLVEDKLKKLKTFDTDYFVSKNYFERDYGTQNVLVFQVKEKYFKREVSIGNGHYVYKYDIWKSKGSSDQSLHYSIKSAVTTKLIRPTHVVLGTDEYFFQDSSKVIANNSIVNIYIVYKLYPKSINTNNVLKNCLLGAIKQVDPIILQILINIFTLDMVLVSITLEYLHILKVI